MTLSQQKKSEVITCQSRDGSFIKTSIVVSKISLFFLRALRAWIMVDSILPFSLSGNIKLRICLVKRNGINSGTGKN